MYRKFEFEEENQVLNFVKSCLGKERFENWKDISKEEENILVNIARPEVLKALFDPEKNPGLVEKYGREFSNLEFLEKHKQCGYDAFLYNRFLNFTKYEVTRNSISISEFFKEKEEAFFSLPEAVPEPGLRTLKSPKNFALKITSLLQAEKETVFFELKANALGCYFYNSFLENVFFPLEKMNLIPSFVRWRNSHFIKWMIQAVQSAEERSFRKFQVRKLKEELQDGERELFRSYYEEYEDRIRWLFEMRPEFKLNLVQQTVDLSSGLFPDVKRIILIRFQDFRSLLKPEIEYAVSLDNFSEDFQALKNRLR